MPRPRSEKKREEKERAARQKAAREAEEAEKRRNKAAREDALANYATLLSEAVKDHHTQSWNEWRPRLGRDPQV